MACRPNLSFENSPPLVLPPGFELTISCPDTATTVNIFSSQGDIDVPESSSLSFRNCQVSTMEDLETAFDRIPPPEISSEGLGIYLGQIYFEGSHVLFPRDVRLLSRFQIMHRMPALTRTCSGLTEAQPAFTARPLQSACSSHTAASGCMLCSPNTATLPVCIRRPNRPHQCVFCACLGSVSPGVSMLLAAYAALVALFALFPSMPVCRDTCLTSSCPQSNGHSIAEHCFPPHPRQPLVQLCNNY